ncbi:glycosyltransferase family 32 protein [Pleurotus eryngii]|uniref:Glycosyltransferase family 32 protein n=1 Tax=Pleurotus eryngii TaxID=5323 RepID=A0A9P6A0N3_PLEER|nr:glycosyltransferase family 32 protein [Pleurotus eryngii]
MVSSVYFPTPRQNGFRDKGRKSTLPSYSSAVQEKLEQRAYKSWWIPIFLPLPGIRTRQFRVYIPNATRIHQSSIARFGRKRGTLVSCLALIFIILATFAFTKRFATKSKQWPTAFVGPSSTLVFRRQDLQRIWQWEIASGHYPSRKDIPDGIRLTVAPENPALPPRKGTMPSHLKPTSGPVQVHTTGVGQRRVYLDIQSRPPNVAYPPRPVPGSIADLDIVLEHCDFSEKQYVRDCLEVLRVGAGLDNGKRVRRGKMDDWKYIYVEHVANGTYVPPSIEFEPSDTDVSDSGLSKKRGVDWEASPIALPPPLPHRPYPTLPRGPCDENHSRIFHMFWTGPFTDKPYVSLLSFLFTQNLGLETQDDISDIICKPQLWVWINPGPAAAIPTTSATQSLFAELKHNPWSSPFLHPRFKEAIHFKLWNTTEQLDSIPELKGEWRNYDLFVSGGEIYSIPQRKSSSTESVAGKTSSDDDLFNRTGSKSSQEYDRLSVILSDMARFVLCHRFGGTYLDADTIFLRDWEDLWGWKGAFAYRWSRLPKYNTAVLHLNKGSALGKFLIRTALRNNNDFHPMVVYRYAKEAHMEGLLLRLPDALFDPAWLNTEDYQRDRPTQPYFTAFPDFFSTSGVYSAQPQALGFEGFFRGSYSYHFHNSWWTAFDEARNWPDLGPKFSAAERAARIIAKANGTTLDEESVADDNRDLSWATVLKRTFEAYIRGERPNMYGEWLQW